ncbi:uncharacterized protein LOC124489986 [Dermatophagoides farinae]|uniref:uncharacterized protein LOC124489986 n=1 Tax=Dermatophagoides farinae TaxID=6954 RepID=UPI003F608E03
MLPSSLTGENFTIGFRNDLPFNWITWNSAKKSYQIQRGIESRLIQDLADYFNFTYHLINIRVFNPKNVSHESVVSRVQNKEIDIGLGGIAMTNKRKQYVDYLYPHVLSQYTYMMARNKAHFNYENIIRPFDTDVWLSLLIVFIVLGILDLITRMIQTSNNLNKPTNLLWISFNLLLRQPYRHLGSIPLSSKMFIIMWALCISIIISFYCCFLLSTLTTQTSMKLQNIYEMTAAISAGKVLPIGANVSVAQHAFFSSSSSNIMEFQAIRDNFQSTKTRKMAIELLMNQIKNSNKKHSFLEKNNEKKIAVLASRDFLHFDQLINGPELLYIPPRKPDSSYFTFMISIPVRTSFPYKEHFNRIIGILQDAGILNHYRSDIETDEHWKQMGISISKARIINNQDSERKNNKYDDIVIFDFKLEHLENIFRLYFLCNILAIFVCIIEIEFFMQTSRI